MKSDEELLVETNSLAREFYNMKGYQVGDNFKFYGESPTRHPDETLVWSMACLAQEFLRDTEIEGNLDYLYSFSLKQLKKVIAKNKKGK